MPSFLEGCILRLGLDKADQKIFGTCRLAGIGIKHTPDTPDKRRAIRTKQNIVTPKKITNFTLELILNQWVIDLTE